jgi:uncharacterized cofD-like protein
MLHPRSPKIVVIGGGTGSFTVLSALKYYARDITAIVNMADDGGSTGILRDELGVLPPGDVRQCLVALSESDEVMRDLFNYRFEEGTFGGHSFGNLLLTTLEKTTGSFAKAVRTAGDVLNITGRVLPVTLDNVTLVLKGPGKEEVRGEFQIAHQTFASRRPELALDPAASLNPEAKTAIAEADIVVIAPGNLYGSLAPALIVDGMAEALQTTPAKIVYISNLVTKPGQTDDFNVHDYAAEIERFAGGQVVDYVLYNTAKPSAGLLARYAKEGEFGVGINEAKLARAHYQAIGENLMAGAVAKQNPADTLIARTLIRHDGDKIAKHIMRIFFS